MSARYARLFIRLVFSVALLVACPVTARAQRTDVVTLANGDRITGEIVRLERGRLVFKTDDAGTLYLEWDNLTSVVTTRQVDLETQDGTRYLGSLSPAKARAIAVRLPAGDVVLTLAEVIAITPIGRSFWRRLDGSVDMGANYTKSSGVGTLTLNSDTVYRRPAFQVRINGSLTITRTDEDDDADDRATLDLSYQRYPWQRWFFLAAGRFESNESLGLILRSQMGVAVGPRLYTSNRGQVAAGAGIAVNDEQGVDVESTRNVEAILVFQSSYFTYDRPTTNFDLRIQYYPSLSDPGRHRAQFDLNAKRELLPDLFVALTLYNSYDNRPPNAAADRNDIGVVASIGWAY